MKHSLYLKFILTYVVFGFLSFFIIATFSSQMTLNHLTSQKAESLYKEANYKQSFLNLWQTSWLVWGWAACCRSSGTTLWRLIHSLGAKLGIFPYFFPPRPKKGEEQKSEWD